MKLILTCYMRQILLTFYLTYYFNNKVTCPDAFPAFILPRRFKINLHNAAVLNQIIQMQEILVLVRQIEII